MSKFWVMGDSTLGTLAGQTARTNRQLRQKNAAIEGETERANGWAAHADQLKAEAAELNANLLAEYDLVAELIDESEGVKPKRLSIRGNKELRNDFREERIAHHKKTGNP